jgi:hypothetical protein
MGEGSSPLKQGEMQQIKSTTGAKFHIENVFSAVTGAMTEKGAKNGGTGAGKGMLGLVHKPEYGTIELVT